MRRLPQAEPRDARERRRGASQGREIRPYTDLLLHDMGDGLADGQTEGLADGRMWRTAGQ
jgi:CxxC motif-containing protein (DUF1111 family)